MIIPILLAPSLPYFSSAPSDLTKTLLISVIPFDLVPFLISWWLGFHVDPLFPALQFLFNLQPILYCIAFPQPQNTEVFPILESVLLIHYSQLDKGWAWFSVFHPNSLKDLSIPTIPISLLPYLYPLNCHKTILIKLLIAPEIQMQSKGFMWV